MNAKICNCKECGKAFEAVNGRLYCSRQCERKFNSRVFRENNISLRAMRLQRERQRDEMKRRLAARDAAFAAAFPQLATGERRGRVSCARGRLRGHLDQFRPTI